MRRSVNFTLTAAAALLVAASPAGAVTVSEPFTSSGTWTIPSGVTSVDILLVGGGGGGGGGTTGNTGGGGGGGEVKVCTAGSLVAGQQLTVTVGAGGTANNLSVLDRGNTGGSSSVTYASSPVCLDALGGQGGNGGQVGPSYYEGGNSGSGSAGGASNNSFTGGGGGGQGGAGADGQGGPTGAAGAGGSGIAPGSLPTPRLFADVTSTLYGGGGGGGRSDSDASLAGDGGTGGGGPGRPKAPGPDGAPNTGGGGGGGGNAPGGLGGGTGGSGYVEIRYLRPVPSNTAQPVVSGSTQVGAILSTTDGAWSASPTSYGYQWQRCDDAQGAGCTDIGGASGATYTTVSADGGKYLRSRVTATNAAGPSTPAASNLVRITPKFALTVSRGGSGSGAVSGPGIDCGATCSAEFDEGTAVTLTATPAPGSQFAGWSGACSGASTCTVTMDAAKAVTARFTSAASNRFTIAASTAGTTSIRSRVRVPGAGRISQRGTRSSASGVAARALVCTDSKKAARAGTYTLTCRANAATRRAQRSGSVRVLLRTTFTPAGGEARTSTRTVTLPALKPAYAG
jgi:hypothetical protein